MHIASSTQSTNWSLSPLLLATESEYDRSVSEDVSRYVDAMEEPAQIAISEPMRLIVGEDFGSASTIVSFEQSLRRIEELYSLNDRSTVKRFISNYPELANLLIEAFPHVQYHFGSYPDVELEVIRDPESDNFEELFAYIRTPLPPEAALKKLDQLDEEWFLDQLPRTEGKFNFNLEFV